MKNNQKKRCINKNCGKLKDIGEFYKDKRALDSLSSWCKECKNLQIKEYERTKVGLIAKIYSSQKKSSKKRNMPNPTYSKQDLADWLYSQPLFHKLYDNWKRLDFQKDYIPSVDRKDDYIGYTMDNIQLMTWKENKTKGEFDRLNGINNKDNKAVVQYTKDNEYIAEFHSLREASRQTKINQGNIGSCCKRELNSAGGYIWKYKIGDKK